MKSFLSGLIAAPFTPFDAHGDIVFDTIPQQAKLLARNGVSGAFICGTTGEGCSLTSAERRATAEKWRETAPAGLKVIVHVGHLSLRESCDLARHAEEIGVDAIATMAPGFFKPVDAEGLAEWCAGVAAAAPKLPFYYYHMPAMTGVQISVNDFLERARALVPSLAGVKFTDEDLFDYSRSGRVAEGRFSMLFGRDEILLAGLSLGAAGAVGSTYNFAAPLFLRLMKRFDEGDLDGARKAQVQAQEIIQALNMHGGLVAGKAAMKLIGLDCGPARLPLRQLTPDNEERLRADLEKVGFFDCCCKLP